MHIVLLVLLPSLILGSVASLAQAPAPMTEARGWCENAKEFLRQRNGKAIDCSQVTSRCVKLNNYGCSQNHYPTPFPGQMKTEDGKPAIDRKKHALYEAPKWSIRQAIATLWKYQQAGVVTPLSIAAKYAPWCDTQGSEVIIGGWGRTCKDQLRSVPASFRGPRCTEKESPSAEQCQNCNCPNKTIAPFYAKPFGGDIKAALKLFDSSGRPTPDMPKFLTQLVIFETGFAPTDRVIKEGIAEYSP